MSFQLPIKSLILALVCGGYALTVSAQWQWIDKDGRKVYSDRAPPAEILPKNILMQPGVKMTALASASAPAAPASATGMSAPKAQASAPRLPGKDAQLEAKKKQAEDEENVKKKAAEEVLAKARADNCERAKKGVATLQSGIRIATTSAKGEREFMDDAGRALETKRLQTIAQTDCVK